MGEDTRFIKTKLYKSAGLSEKEIFRLMEADRKAEEIDEYVKEEIEEEEKEKKALKPLIAKISAAVGTGAVTIAELLDYIDVLN